MTAQPKVVFSSSRVFDGRLQLLEYVPTLLDAAPLASQPDN